MPGKLKVGPHLPKPLLLRSLEDQLPKEIVRRPKKGFVFPFDCWLRERLKVSVEAELLEKDAFLDQILNSKAIADIWKDFLKRRISWQRPWAIYVLKRLNA